MGAWYSRQFQLQLKNLKRMCLILELLNSEIRYGRCTLPECCFQLATRVDEPYKGSFIKIYELACMNDGHSFGQLCREVLEEGMKKEVLMAADKELFISCFQKTGFADNDMQFRNIERVKVEMETRMQELTITNTAKCRLAISLGAMSGLLIVILFL